MLNFFRKKEVCQIISWIVLGSFLCLIQGCAYYKVHQSKGPAAPAITGLQNEKKFFILHYGTNVWQLTNITAREDSVKGSLLKLIGHETYKKTDTIGVNRFKKESSNSLNQVLNEVHIYVSKFYQKKGNEVSFPTNAVKKIEIYDPATGANIASAAGGLLGAVAVVLIIVALTKESCPFIYVNDDNSSKFAGEIYSGAIYSSLERPDYLPLPGPAGNKKEYTIKMTNEAHEIQNTNLIELNVFDHPAGIKVFMDKYGKYQTVADPQAPVKATDLNGNNILDLISRKDTLVYFNASSGKDKDLEDGIIMTFKRPQNTSVAKLLVNIRTTFWLDYTFTKFHELFGNKYNCWVDKQQTVSPVRMKSWMLDQNIPLSVYIEKNKKWQFADYYNIVGPMALKEDVIPIDISGITTDDIRIKLGYGRLFWEVDYAAIDYSVNIPVTHRIAEFVSAVDDRETDVKNLLASPDMLYYTMPEVGNSVNMKFSLPEKVDAEQSLILHSQGYYRILLDLTGKQQKKDLLAFRKKGHFVKFSNEIYKEQAGADPK